MMENDFKENKSICYYKVAIAIILTMFLGVIFLNTSFVHKCESKLDLDKEDSRRNITANITIGSDIIGERILRLVPRVEWLAEPANEPLDKLELPVHRVIIAHTATYNCVSQFDCTYQIRTIQNFHMRSRHFSDIAYNFLVGGDGSVYEGRGWDRQGAHTKGYNVDSIGIAFIGTFAKITPPEKQLNAAKLIIAEGVKLNKLVKNYRLYGASQLVASDNTGSALYEIINKWSNWSPNL